jgi:hypothetical protein
MPGFIFGLQIFEHMRKYAVGLFSDPNTNMRNAKNYSRVFLHNGGIAELVTELCTDKEPLHPTIEVFSAK